MSSANQRVRVNATTVVIDRGDITREHTEAIVNAANSTLLGGGGVDGAIHDAAGPRLLAACRAMKAALPGGELATGSAVITPGFDLRARYVIHCVGPVYRAAGFAAPRLLASCYSEALRLCREHGLNSVAFPSISTGAFGYPVDAAAAVAFEAVRDSLRAHGGPVLVKFVLFDDATFAAYLRAAPVLTE